MRLLSTLLLAFLCLSFNSLQAQVSKDATVPITATLNTGPIGITLTWANPGNANLLILRRTKGQAGNAWVQLINVTASNLTSLTDNGVANGQIYEYVIQRTLGTLNAFGYAHVAVNANPVTTRGKVLIFTDSTTANALSVELTRLENDLRGDGWWPISFKTGPSSTVQSVKNQIVASYNTDPLNVKSVLLLGNIPIPYSGNANWDGHAEHAGAWPSDAYYADVNGVWTDVSIDNVTPARAANVNVPGDGKFDQSYMPTAAELQVGRVDFRRLNAPAFGAADAVGLMKRYLDKNHKWRIGDYTVQNKALVDDNFGYFGGEAFAANGWRNAYPLVGEANIIETDFFDGTESQTYLLGYGTGGGTYQSAGGVGSSANFATDSVNIVFSNLFGSYHGDWDFESDPFMPAALASRGGILTCSWAGRPHWFNQALASGETIGYCNWETMNAQFNNGFFGSFGESGAHVALLGDPTLRANVVKPATNLVLTAPTCNTVVLNWTASADAVSGYHVYRALSPNGTYTRLTTTPITATTYTDLSPLLDTLYYQVRAIKNVTNPGGGTYANNAIGPIQSIVFVAAGGPTVTTTGGTLDCITTSVTLTTSASAPVTTWAWTGPNNFSSNQQSPSVSNVGTYTLTATDAAGCSATATAVVLSNYAVPILTATVSNTINCANTTATITVSATGLSLCTITGPGNLFVQGFTATVSLPGTYTVSIVSSVNGCLANGTVQVIADNTIPTVSASNSGPITCLNTSSQLMASSSVPGTTFAWSGSCLNGTIANCPGVYTVTVTNPANGCTSSATTMVAQDITPPSVSAQSGVITCNDPTVLLSAVVSPNNSTTQWSGPCVVPGNPPAASCAGVYTVVATSTNGCTSSASIAVTEDTQLPNFNLSAAVLTCLGPCAIFTVPDLPGYQVIYQGQVIPPGASIQICDPGQITITIKSIATGCTKEVNLVITQDTNVPIASAGQDVTLTCNAPSALLSSAGSSVGANFTLLWTGPNGFSSGQPTPMVSAPGTYTLLITNTINGCSNTDVVQVFADPNLPTANPGVSGPINCANPAVQLFSGNNTPGVTYTWSPSTGLSCTTCPNPSASLPGTYTVVVSVGTCAASASVVVVKAPDLVVNSNPFSVNCDGVIMPCLNVSGGTPPYSYLWSNGDTTPCATYSNPAAINVKVTDAGGCVYQSPTINVNQPVMVLNTIVVNESAPNANNGSIDLSPSGSSGPFSYAWSNGATTQDLTGLGDGTYTVTVTDLSTGCIKTASATVGTMVGTTETALFEQFLLSPNPTEGHALLSLKLHKSAAIRVEVRDLAGRLILDYPPLETSVMNLSIDLSGSPAGIYAVSVWIENQVFVRKLAVIR